MSEFMGKGLPHPLGGSTGRSQPESKRLFEFRSWHTGLADDRHQGTCPEFFVIGHRDRYRAPRYPLLHDDMTSFPSHLLESMPLKYQADFPSGEDF